MDMNFVEDIVKSALKAGADAAEAALERGYSRSLTIREGRLEDITQEEGKELGLRVFVGKSQAVVSGSDFSASSCQFLVERAVAMARLAPEDIYAGLAPKDRLFSNSATDLELYDSYDRDKIDLEAQARGIEAAALAVPGVTKSDGGTAGWSFGDYAMATSEGFRGQSRTSIFSLSVGVIAGEGEHMEAEGEGRATRFFADLPDAEKLGEAVGKRAVAKSHPRKIASCNAPVLFENRIAMSLIKPLIGAASGPAVARGVSFLKDHLGKAIFSKDVHIVDDPHRKRGLGSTLFDDEGVITQPFDLIKDGILQGWLLNMSSARQLKLETTGHASRSLAGAPGVSTHNLTVQPGQETPHTLRQSASQALWVTSLFSPSLNPNTGDWSVGVSGFWLEKGEIAFPVTEITVAGNLLDIYQRLVPANDLEIRGASNAPSLWVENLTIAGS